MTFKTLKIYKNQIISQEILINELGKLGYKRCPEILEEKDFSVKGEILEVWPVTFEYPIRIEWEFDKINRIFSFEKTSGLSFWEHEVVIILPVFKRKTQKILFTEETPISNFLELEPGDFCVHVKYGIAKFLGRRNIKNKEYFELEFDNKDKLFVPLEDAHLIQKYISFGFKKPRLSKLGSKQWLKVKERVRKGIHEFALELLRIQALRKIRGGFKFSPDTDWQKIFEESFMYEETPDQKKAILEAKKDMESEFCMDRLVCGDTGYGKTEVAMRCAFKACMDSKQVAFLVPTTILALQHYKNFLRRIRDFPIRVEMLSRLVPDSKQKEIIRDLKKGKVDIVIGTHKLLSPEIEFKDLGLLIVDEEQRFGVEAKEKIKKLKTSVDVLTLTATPIPRTLYMALTGLKDISLITTPPKERISVKTFVCEFDKELIKQAILREIKRGGQVFFVHNRIKDIYEIKRMLKALLPDEVKVEVAHGKMLSKELEKVIIDFIEHKLQVLVCTNIIESGIDIPKANTLIVNNAHLFGLADLHQLRGRVGRLNIQAYAYFLVPSFSTLPKDAQKRLEAIQKFSELGAGFYIAMQDLEIRGAGNLLGPEQHGFVYSVGFDMYCRLLREEIEKIKKEEILEKLEV